MQRPLGLPIGSVRALSLMGLVLRAALDLYQGRGLEPWLGTAVGLCGAAYFSARAARSGLVVADPENPGTAPTPPLGFPSGTLRFLLLLGLGIVAFAYVRHEPLSGERAEAALVVGGFATGILVRWFLTQVRRPEDASTLIFEHLQGIASLLAAGGLATFALTGTAGTLGWVEPALAAACAYYTAVR